MIEINYMLNWHWQVLTIKFEKSKMVRLIVDYYYKTFWGQLIHLN